MAELATIARPVRRSPDEGVGERQRRDARGRDGRALADVAANAQMRQFADNPKIEPDQVFDLVTGIARTPTGAPLGDAAKNLLRTVIDNGRLAALPEIAAQFQALVDERSAAFRRRRS